MKTYKPREHAIDRAIERLDTSKMPLRSQVASYLTQLMQMAEYQGDSHSKAHGDCRVYDNHRKRVRMIVNGKDEIVTCYRMTDSFTPVLGDDPIAESVRKTVRRELAKAEREAKRQTRTLEIAKARKLAEIAQAGVNRLTVCNPKTAALIGVRIDEMQSEVSSIDTEIARVAETLETARRAAKVYGVASL